MVGMVKRELGVRGGWIILDYMEGSNTFSGEGGVDMMPFNVASLAESTMNFRRKAVRLRRDDARLPLSWYIEFFYAVTCGGGTC